jgi:hypothetical protein
MEGQILRKLNTLLREGINSEPQAVYLMVEIRKLLEQHGAKQQYRYLNFHCNWALHSKLSHDAAQNVLKHLDEANTHLKTGKKLHELPQHLQNEIDNLSNMTYFKSELEAFLQVNRLPPINAVRSDGWVYFLHFYANVVSDCPLVVAADNAAARIRSVTVKVELANQSLNDHMMFKVTWEVLDKNGLSGSLDIYNSFSLKPEAA